MRAIDIISYTPLLSSISCIISLLTNASKYTENPYAPFFIINSTIGAMSYLLVAIIAFKSYFLELIHYYDIEKKPYVLVVEDEKSKKMRPSILM